MEQEAVTGLPELLTTRKTAGAISFLCIICYLTCQSQNLRSLNPITLSQGVSFKPASYWISSPAQLLWFTEVSDGRVKEGHGGYSLQSLEGTLLLPSCTVFTFGALIRCPGIFLLLLVPLSSFIEAAIALDNYIHPPWLPLHKLSWKAELMTHPSLI